MGGANRRSAANHLGRWKECRSYAGSRRRFDASGPSGYDTQPDHEKVVCTPGPRATGPSTASMSRLNPRWTLLALVASLIASTPSPAPALQSEEPALPAPEPRKPGEVPDLFANKEPADTDQATIEFSAEVFESYIKFFPARSTLIGLQTYQSVL